MRQIRSQNRNQSTLFKDANLIGQPVVSVRELHFRPNEFVEDYLHIVMPGGQRVFLLNPSKGRVDNSLNDVDFQNDQGPPNP